MPGEHPLLIVEAPPVRARRQSHQWRRAHVLLDSALLCGICALTMFAPLAFGAVEEWSQLVLRTGAATLFLIWTARQSSTEEVTIIWNPLFVPACLFGLLLLAQSVLPLSAYRQATFNEMLNYCAYGILLFLGAQAVRRDSQARAFAIAMTAFGFLLACFAIAQNLSAPGMLYWVRKPAEGGAVFGPYVNRSNYAGLMEMLFPIPLIMSMERGASGGKKSLWIFAALVMAGSIVVSQSRGGLVSSVIAVVCLGIYVGRRNWRSALTVVGLVVLTAAFVLTSARGNVLERFEKLGPEQRITIVRDGMRMFLRHPVVGWGLETFPSVYPAFRSFYTDEVVNEAHNDFLQVLVETGILGFVCLVAFVVLLYRTGLRRLRHWRASPARALVLAALVGCTGILAHSAVDFNLHIPANAAFFYLLCGIAASTAEPDNSPN